MMKSLLLIAGFLTVVVFVMPSAFSLFQGQHQFVSGANVDCEKCHTDVATELSAGETAMKNFSCTQCHPTASGGEGYHTVKVVECIYCHSNVTTEFGDPKEVHKPFYESASGLTWLEGANEACVSCHTHTQVGINWSKPIGYNLTARVNATGDWELSDWTVYFG